MGMKKIQEVSAFADVAWDQWLSGVVLNTIKHGVLVDVSAPDGDATARGLVHSSKIKPGVIGRLKVGQEVQVRVMRVDRRTGRLDLTMLDLDRQDLSAFADVASDQ